MVPDQAPELVLLSCPAAETATAKQSVASEKKKRFVMEMIRNHITRESRDAQGLPLCVKEGRETMARIGVG